MPLEVRKSIDAASRINDAEEARKLLQRGLSPALVRAMALRADEIRSYEPWSALAIAEVALEAWSRLTPATHQSGTTCLAWAVYGSACRTVARFKEAELALAVAIEAAPRSRAQLRADLTKRWAYLRADQGYSAEVGPLVVSFLSQARRVGGRYLGRQLVDAGTISILIKDNTAASAYLREAMNLLPHN